MDKSSFRITNYVNFKGVESQLDNGCLLEQTESEDMKGIPLNEDWAERLGFVRVPVPDDEEGRAMKLAHPEVKLMVFHKDDLTLHLNLNKDGDITNNCDVWIYEQIVDGEGILSMQATHGFEYSNMMVHELQNFWFGIKRENLMAE